MNGSCATHVPTPTEVHTLGALLPADLRIAAMAPTEASIDALDPLEALLVSDASAERRRQFAAGRGCAHVVMASLQARPAPLLRERDGAPAWPRTVRGSISHKSRWCLAVAGAADVFAGIGIDLEARRALPSPVWARVFTAAERRHLEAAPPTARTIRARLCFSAKECYYKWYRSQGGLHEPDFDEVEVEVIGTALHVHPAPTSTLPAVSGCFVDAGEWIITVLWSYVIPVDGAGATSSHHDTSGEVEHHGHTHRSTVHA